MFQFCFGISPAAENWHFLPVFCVSESSVNRYSTVSQYKCGYKSCLFPKMPDKEKKRDHGAFDDHKNTSKNENCAVQFIAGE